MTRRTYNQFCGLARSLDTVGERWTLLIVRELMSGPKRYTDLSDTLDGIGTSLLTSRIRQLEDDGIIDRRRLPPPAASLVYQLTPAGRELAEALLPLAIWGIRHRLDETRKPGETYRAEWTLVFIAQLIDPEAAAGVHATYEFRIDDSVAQLQLHDRQVSVVAGESAAGVDATITTDFATLVDISLGHLDNATAIANGRITVDGDPVALQTLLCGLPQPTPPDKAFTARARGLSRRDEREVRRG